MLRESQIEKTYIFNDTNKTDDSSFLDVVLLRSQYKSLWYKDIQIEEMRNDSSAAGDLFAKYMKWIRNHFLCKTYISLYVINGI